VRYRTYLKGNVCDGGRLRATGFGKSGILFVGFEVHDHLILRRRA
jgi:hypothetical protein